MTENIDKEGSSFEMCLYSVTITNGNKIPYIEYRIGNMETRSGVIARKIRNIERYDRQRTLREYDTTDIVQPKNVCFEGETLQFHFWW